MYRERQSDRNPFLFVVGCPRSGTTLLQRMLDHHPQLAVAYDTLFIPAVLRNPPTMDPPVDHDLIERIRNFRRFERFGLPAGILDRLAPDATCFSELVRLVYTEFAAMHGKPLGGEKSPGYVRHMPLLQNLFPAARFIHLVRDGRDVALSLADWGRLKNRPKGPARMYRLWDENPLAVSALWWEYKVAQGRNDASSLRPDSYTEMRYEDLVASPDTELERLTDFLGLPYSEAMVRFHVGKTRNQPGLSAKSAWLPATQGIRDWRRSMPDNDVQLFEALAGDCLSDCGYERRYSDIPEDTARLADHYRATWREKPPPVQPVPEQGGG